MRAAARCFGLLIDKIKALFRAKPVEYVKFRDPVQNFEIFYPKGWRFDRDVAVDDGKYTISFESGRKRATVFVDFKLPAKFNFRKYIKEQFEGPSSGIICSLEKTKFRGMPAYKREYCYVSSGKEYASRSVVFYTGSKVYSLTWFGPQDFPEEIFNHMLKSMIVRS